jgi:hypothetical protein
MTQPAGARRYGPEVGEPPPAVDPRRWGSLIGLVGGLGVIGLLIGAVGVEHAAEALAVASGLAMLIVITLYARGRFAPA